MPPGLTLPEECGPYKNMKVRGVLRFNGGLTNTGDFKREVNCRLEKLDLAEWADKKAEALSKVLT